MKHAQVATMEDRLQQAEQRLRDGDFAAAEEQAKAVLSDGPSYEAHMCGFLAMQCCIFFSFVLAVLTAILRPVGKGRPTASCSPCLYLWHF